MPHGEHSVGLRTVAIFEAAKGVVVLLLGFGVLALMHKNLDEVAERLTEILRINPEGRLSGFFLHAANRATEHTLWLLATGALVYSAVRFIEAYGLWHEREWAQWFALLSGALYLPGELYSLVRHPHPFKWVIVGGNVLIVLYMLMLRIAEQRQATGAI